MSACAIAEPEFALQAVHSQPLVGHFVADHLGWWRPAGHPRSWCRLVEGPDTPWLLTSPDLHIAGAHTDQRLHELPLPTEGLALLPPSLARRLVARAPLLRIGTPNLCSSAAATW